MVFANCIQCCQPLCLMWPGTISDFIGLGVIMICILIRWLIRDKRSKGLCVLIQLDIGSIQCYEFLSPK